MEKEECYVCTKLVDCVELDGIHVVTKYTKTPIPEIIQKLLGTKGPSRFAVNDSVCMQCVQKFNEYDLACVTVKTAEAELKHVLMSNDNIYLKEEVVEYAELDVVINDKEYDDDGRLSDFQRYQVECDDAMAEVRAVTFQELKKADGADDGEIEYLEIDEPLVYEESEEESSAIQNDAQSDSENSQTKASSRRVEAERSQQQTEADWRRMPTLKAWLETIDGNEKQVNCKFCKTKVLALKSSLIEHDQSHAHIVKISAQNQKTTIEARVDSDKLVDTVQPAVQMIMKEEPPLESRITERSIAHKQYTQRVRKVWKSQPKFENWLHIIDDDDSRVQCKYCDMEMSAKKSVLQKHAKSKKHIESMNAAYNQSAADEATAEASNSAQLVCPHCHQGFFSANQLKIHVQKLHKSKRCGICGKRFEKFSDLKAHQESDHEMGKYVCHICGKELKSAVYLSRHITIHETGQTLSLAESGQNVFRCDLCGQVEQNDTNLLAHIALHDNKLKCVICGNVVKHKGNLILHMRIHTGEKFYQCHKCGKEFIHKSSLRMHLATTHTVERKKQCNQCPLSFKTTSQLNQHTLTHTGEKNHKCPECGKCFAQRYNMMAHYKLHMGISRHSKKNVCPICNITFEKPSQLEQHCIKIHLRAR